MLRYIILCLFFSTQSCNLGDDFSNEIVREDTGGDVSEEASEGCKNYCSKVENTCLGDNILYPSIESCLDACSLFPDRPDAKGAFRGDTLQCRFYHLGAASSNPSIHCPHGSAKSVPTACQDIQTLCSTYCGEISELCVQDFEIDFGADGITTLQNCLNVCPGTIPKDGQPMANDTTDTVNCRLSQLSQKNCAGGRVASTICIVPFE